MQTNLFMTVNCAKLKKIWITHRSKGITYMTDVYNNLSFVTHVKVDVCPGDDLQTLYPSEADGWNALDVGRCKLIETYELN